MNNRVFEKTEIYTDVLKVLLSVAWQRRGQAGILDFQSLVNVIFIEILSCLAL